jgi:DNA-binding NarL/FixJ family response regulator
MCCCWTSACRGWAASAPPSVCWQRIRTHAWCSSPRSQTTTTSCALRLGARGYLVKQDVGTIPDALRAVVAGQSVFGPEVCERLDLLVGRGSEGLRDAPGENAGRAGGERGETRRCGAPAPRDEGAAPASLDALTERERAIAALVAEGLDNREVAGTLYLSEGTVRNHISAMLQKLGLRNRTQLALAWWRARG